MSWKSNFVNYYCANTVFSYLNENAILDIGNIMGQLSKKIGKRIKEIREGLGIKQFELAEMLEMEPSNLTRIESGYQMPKEENITKIAEKLGVKEHDLFDFEHFQNKDALIKQINEILAASTQKEVEFIYKLLINTKQLLK